MSGRETRSSGGCRPRNGLAQRGLDRLLELLDAEGALEPRRDPPVAIDGEQPRFCLQMERPERRAQPLAYLVVAVDLLVDEGHAIAVLLLHLQLDVDDRPADARLAQLRRCEQQRDRLAADDVLE